MIARSRLLISSLVVASAAGSAVGRPASAQTSAYKTPVAGNWKIQDSFDTAGGTVTLAKKGTELRNLSVNVGPDEVDDCGEGAVKVVGVLKIKRVGSFKRPAVGRFSSKTQLIESIGVGLETPAGKAEGTVKILFEKDGKSAFTSQITFGECNLGFALRRK